jgi:hypothetical protein
MRSYDHTYGIGVAVAMWIGVAALLVINRGRLTGPATSGRLSLTAAGADQQHGARSPVKHRA